MRTSAGGVSRPKHVKRHAPLTDARSVVFVALPEIRSSETVVPPWVSVTWPSKPEGVRAAVTRRRFLTRALAYS